MSELLLPSHLPLPSRAEQAQTTQVMNHLKVQIKRAGGQLNFANYMQTVLYEPKLGYYRSATPKFGKYGDFITAPELSPLFSRALANQCEQILATLGGGDVLEFGAGSGTMAAEILLQLAKKDQLPEHYYIIELSAELKERQFNTLQNRCHDLLERITWLDKLPEQPIRGVILANEVIDAMPVHLFRLEQEHIFERYVAWQGNELCWHLDEVSTPELHAQLAAIQQHLPDFILEHGYESEINAYLPQWIATVAQLLACGVVLVIDYGFPAHEYYHPDRYQGTLMCHYHHHTHSDPLIIPGLQDVTAHVDFTALAHAATNAGLHVAGFTPQAHFLLACHLLDVAYDLAQNEQELFTYNQQIKQLTLPHEMGELFKVMALTQAYDASLMGFSHQDQRHRL